MTVTEARAELRTMLRQLRRRSGRIAAEQVRRYEAALRRLAERLSDGRSTILSSAGANRLQRQVRAILDEVEAVLAGAATTAIETVASEIKAQYQVVHARLFKAASLPSGGIVQKFEVLPKRTLAAMAKRAGRTLSVDRVVARNLNDARAAVERFVEAATGQIPDQVAVRSVLRLLDGELPVDLKGIGLEATDVSAAKGLLARGRRIIVTESFNAMRTGTAEASKISPIILAARWTLSDRHADLPSSPDECDEIAEDDVGFGKGWYLPEDWPRPPHPYCGCYQGDTRVLDPDEWGAAA